MHGTDFWWRLLFSLQAFKKIDTDKKKEDLDKMKSKYGLSTPEKKWTFPWTFETQDLIYQ